VFDLGAAPFGFIEAAELLLSNPRGIITPEEQKFNEPLEVVTLFDLVNPAQHPDEYKALTARLLAGSPGVDLFNLLGTADRNAAPGSPAEYGVREFNVPGPPPMGDLIPIDLNTTGRGDMIFMRLSEQFGGGLFVIGAAMTTLNPVFQGDEVAFSGTGAESHVVLNLLIGDGTTASLSPVAFGFRANLGFTNVTPDQPFGSYITGRVPAPATLPLVGIGLAGLVLRRYRQMRWRIFRFSKTADRLLEHSD